MYTVSGKSPSAGFTFVTALAAFLLTPICAHAQGDNTITGNLALFHDTTGSYNTADGLAALEFNTTGINNTAVGNAAMNRNISGSANTVAGGYALYENLSGSCNTAYGYYALFPNTASCNTAIGYCAMRNSSTGGFNTALGLQAMYGNSTGGYNTASGYNALYTNMTGIGNVAFGVDALFSDIAGSSNVALGYEAGYMITGTGNIALGGGAGFSITTGNNNIAIANSGASTDTGIIRIGTPGVQTQAFVSGIAGTGITGAIPVYITSGGQLGVIRSSARFKYDIHNIGSVSDKLMNLRPVTFRYKDADQDGSHSLQYGLIAEEVAKVYPDLVQYDKQGKPFTVYYHLLTPMILDQLQKAHHQLGIQQTQFNSLKLTVQNQSSALQKQSVVLEAQSASMETQSSEVASLKHMVLLLVGVGSAFALAAIGVGAYFITSKARRYPLFRARQMENCA